MIHGDLLDTKPAAPALEEELGVEQGRSREQRRRRLQNVAPHQLESAIDVTDAHAVERSDQEVEDAGNHEPVARVGAMPPPARRQISARHQVGERAQVGRVELAIAVHERDIVHLRGAQPVGHRDAVSAFAVVRQHAQPAAGAAHRHPRHGHGVIGAPIVDQDDLPIGRQPIKDRDALSDHRGHVGRLVVRRDDQAQRAVKPAHGLTTAP